MSRLFPVSVVVSSYHNQMMCPIFDLQAFLSYMNQADVRLREIPSAKAACKPALARQFPWLKDLEVPSFASNKQSSGVWMRRLSHRLGSFELAVTPQRKGVFKPMNSSLEGL